jgi:hypothetical protein
MLNGRRNSLMTGFLQELKAWQPCGFSVNALPSDLKDKFLRIHGAAVEKAKAAGWSGEDELKSD